MADSDFEEVLSVEVDGNVLAQSRFDDIVNTLMPEGISRFFLFDGELLQEYEELLINESEAGHRISEAIERILGVPILFAYNVRADMPEEVVYKMLNAFYQNRAKLAAIDSGFAALSKDFVGMQVAGINANPDVPVHPGLAKLLKEHKAWDDKWKVAGSGS